MSKNNVRTQLRNDLMSFSKVVNRIDLISEYLDAYQKERKEKGKSYNEVDLSYSFLNFARTKVYVFGTLLMDKKSFSDDTMFNLLCAITELPVEDFDQSIRNGKEWSKVVSIGFESLIKAYDQYLIDEAAAKEAAVEAAAKVETIEDVAKEAAAKSKPKSKAKAKAA